MKIHFHFFGTLKLLWTAVWLPVLLALAAATDTTQYPRDCIATSVEGAEQGTRSLRCKSFPDQLPDTVVYLIVKRESPAKLDASHLLPLANLKILSLQGLDIEAIEDEALAKIPNLEVLNLANTKLTRLTNLTFHHCYNLVELNLEFVKLKHIQLGAFVNLRSLQRLYLSNDALYEIPKLLPSSLNELVLSDNFLSNLPEISTALNKLQKLDLCGNTFKQYSTHNFNAPNLGYLCLGDQIAHIDNETFRGHNGLHTLQIKSKELSFYDILRSASTIQSLEQLNVYLAWGDEGNATTDVAFRLPNLKHLQMIQVHGTVQPKLFLTMPNLEILDLHASPQLASTLLNSDGTLENLGSVTTLRLAETNTSQLPESSLSKLKKLKRLNIISNPIHCDCNLKWLVSRILDHELEVENLPQTVCNSPSQVYLQQLTSELVLEEICISINHSRSAKGFEFDDDANQTHNERSNEQTHQDDNFIKLSHVMYAIIGVGALIAILIIIVIVIMCLPKWRKRHERETHSRRHRNSLDLVPSRHSSLDTFTTDNIVIPYSESSPPQYSPKRCTSTTFKRRTSDM